MGLNECFDHCMALIRTDYNASQTNTDTLTACAGQCSAVVIAVTCGSVECPAAVTAGGVVVTVGSLNAACRLTKR